MADAERSPLFRGRLPKIGIREGSPAPRGPSDAGLHPTPSHPARYTKRTIPYHIPGLWLNDALRRRWFRVEEATAHHVWKGHLSVTKMGEVASYVQPGAPVLE